jgi:hypothetical protein
MIPLVLDVRIRSTELRAEEGECAGTKLTRGFAAFFDPHVQIGELPSTEVELAEENVSTAEHISIQYAGNFKIVTETYSKEQYVLTQCGTTQPSDAEVDEVTALEEGYTRKFFTIPLETVMITGTVGLSFFEALGLEDRVVYVSQYATGPCWQKALSCGADGSTALDEEREAMDGVFMDCSWGGDCSNVNGMPNAIHISASQDPGPLHSAEHIKFVAAFFNKEPMARTLFEETVSAYTSAAADHETTPVVAWISYNAQSSWSDESFVISMATYKMHYVTAAGGVNVDREAIVNHASLGGNITAVEASTGWTLTVYTADFANKQEAADAFWEALGDVDAVVDETYAYDPSSYTYDHFLQNYGLNETSISVYRTDGTHTPAYGLDWFESRIAHPEWAVEGLVRVLHGDASRDRHYFRNLGEGEVPEILSHDSCPHAELPQCADSYPAVIPMISLILTTSEAPTTKPETTTETPETTTETPTAKPETTTDTPTTKPETTTDAPTAGTPPSETGDETVTSVAHVSDLLFTMVFVIGFRTLTL